MNLRKNTYRQIMEFNKKTFREKARRRRREAKLPFEEKLKIVEELNTLIGDFAGRRANKNVKKRPL
jgi:hypothetical protein